jgi:hypothetical protein
MDIHKRRENSNLPRIARFAEANLGGFNCRGVAVFMEANFKKTKFCSPKLLQNTHEESATKSR